MTATYITTTIPYVNARPHIGHALELVQADVLARYYRGRGDAVRFQAGTDDNSLKNVLAAGAAGIGVREFVDRNAEAFLALGGALSLTVDDFIRTSRDPRHRPGVEAFWRACSGDLYLQRYTGLYCTGCEQFYTPAQLRDGRCPEHETEPEPVSEENWFFRLSLGNLVNRVVAMIGRYRAGRIPGPVPVPPGGEDLDAAIRQAGDLVRAALAEFDFRQATAAVWAIADEANRFVNRVRPWDLAKADPAGRLDAVLYLLARACAAAGRELTPFLPDAAARVTAQLTPGGDGRLPAPCPVFRRLARG